MKKYWSGVEPIREGHILNVAYKSDIHNKSKGNVVSVFNDDTFIIKFDERKSGFCYLPTTLYGIRAFDRFSSENYSFTPLNRKQTLTDHITNQLHFVNNKEMLAESVIKFLKKMGLSDQQILLYNQEA
jgi:hypothetical protein